jgi:ribonuclease HI
MSTSIWAPAPEHITEHMMRIAKPDAKQWIFMMINSLDQNDLTRYLVMLWAIWFARRKAIHKEIFQSPLFTYSFVDSFLSDLESAPGSKKKHKLETPQAAAQRWIASPMGVAKINVDAVVKKTRGIGSVAAVCWSSEGAFLIASAVVIHGMVEALTLEAVACEQALALADLQLTRIKVASDCVEVINSLDGIYMGKFSSVLHEIKSRSLDFAEASFVHERRASNTEAHGLARSSVSRDAGRHLWLGQTPDEICIPINIIVE